MQGDTHGDAYMNAFQLTLASCPWLPVIGNHESFLGPGGDTSPVGTTERYLNQSWGVAYGQAHSQQQGQFDEAIDTSTTALGSFLTKGSYYGVGSHGSKPSGTSRTCDIKHNTATWIWVTQEALLWAPVFLFLRLFRACRLANHRFSDVHHENSLKKHR